MAGNIRFGNYLKKLRENKDWTLLEVEAKTKQIDPTGKGISNASISRMERAIQDPEEPRIIDLLSQVYSVPKSEMLRELGLIDEVKESFEAYDIDGNLIKRIKDIPSEEDREMVLKVINTTLKRHGLPPIEES